MKVTVDGLLVASKLGQMNSEMGNFLMMGSESAQVSRIDLDETMRHFKRRAQEKDETLINRSGLGNSSTLFKHFQRLSGILLRSMPDSVPSLPPIIWTNPETRYPLPSPILTALKTNCMV